MSAADVLARCQARGVQLEVDRGRILLRGPVDARDELRPYVVGRKTELLILLTKETPAPSTSTPSTSTSTSTRPSLPPDGPGEKWAFDWRGRPVNLFGLRPGEDGVPPIFTVQSRPEGLQ